jgi:hypothetical protein
MCKTLKQIISDEGTLQSIWDLARTRLARAMTRSASSQHHQASRPVAATAFPCAASQIKHLGGFTQLTGGRLAAENRRAPG